MLAIRETLSYTATRNELIGTFAAFIGAILLAVLIGFCIVAYRESTNPETIEQTALPSHYVPSHIV